MKEYLLADEQELTRLALETLIKQQGEVSISQIANKSQLISLLRKNGDCVVVIDYTTFDFSDVENFLIVTERFPLANWILISEELTESMISKVICTSRQVSIVFKDTPVSMIKEAIESASRGQRYICQRAAEILLNRQKEPSTSSLTQTELDILRLIAQGKTTKEIALLRDISIHTVNTHRKNIFKKLNVNTAHEAVKYAFRAGLVDSSEFYI